MRGYIVNEQTGPDMMAGIYELIHQSSLQEHGDQVVEARMLEASGWREKYIGDGGGYDWVAVVVPSRSIVSEDDPGFAPLWDAPVFWASQDMEPGEMLDSFRLFRNLLGTDEPQPFDLFTGNLADSLGKLLEERDALIDLLEQVSGQRDDALARVEELELAQQQLEKARLIDDPAVRKAVAGGVTKVVLAVIAAIATLGAAHITADANHDNAVTASQTELVKEIIKVQEQQGTLPTDHRQLVAVVKDDTVRLMNACRTDQEPGQ